VVTPSFNQGRFLERTILSVLEQNDPHLRYAVIDGGSTDNSLEIIRKYEKHLTFWCSEPDDGQSAAIVKGFQEIGGDIRGWINSDDEYVSGAFRRVRKTFAKDPKLTLVYGERVLIDADSSVLGWSRSGPYNPQIAGYTIASETAFWTEVAEARVGSIDTSLRFAMDLDFFTRLFLEQRSVKLDHYLGKFRCHDESKSATIADVGAEEAGYLWEKYFGPSETWRVRPKRQHAKHALAGLIHPRLLGIPYFKQKFLTRAGS
jgi:glycosyltransferase involved in cell wall biosynthesis